MVDLAGIRAEHVEAVWPLVEKHIKRALEYGDGEFQAEDIRACCQRQEMQLFAVGGAGHVTGAGVTQIVNYPRRKYLDLILWASDRPLEEYIHLFSAIEAWAETIGATPRLFGRKGWARRLTTYTPRYTVFVRTS